MMIARRVLEMKDGRKVKPGEPVPEFHEWSQVVQRAHLSLGWVEEVKDERKSTTRKTRTTAPKADLPPGEFKCHLCGGEKSFQTVRSLKGHITKNHKIEQ